MIKQLAQTSLLGALLMGSAHASDFEGVVLYERTDYRGDTLVLYPGEGIPDLDDYWHGFFDSWEDEISSAAVWGPVTVYLYEHTNYQGDVLVLNTHTDTFYEWNNEASSVWVDYTPLTGWIEDTSLDSWIYWEADGWIWHDQGLGWIYGGEYEPYVGGWLWDSSLGWVYTNTSLYPWLIAPNGAAYYFYTGNAEERWFYDETYGWNIR